MAILVLDVGSSGLKAALVGDDGRIEGLADEAYGASGRTHRQDPETWWQAAVAATRRLSPGNLDAIALTGTMENLIPIAADGTALGTAILYSDPCGADPMARMADALAAANATAITGNPPEPLMTAFKLGCLRETEPERFEKAAFFLPGGKDFLALKLTGRHVTDPTTATTTGLMALATRDWSEPLLALHGIARERLPAIAPADAIIGMLGEAPARALGLAPGLPVVNGCGDGGATTLGSGAGAAGDTSLYLGTSGWVARVVSPAEAPEPRGFYRLAHPAGPDIVEIAPILSAGAAASWARTALGLDLASAEALASGADAEPGAALFLPYLNGERSPFLDLDLRAGFVNLSGDAGPGALYLAVLEGVAMAIARNLEAMGGAKGGRVSLAGGGALSPLWRQVIADFTGAEIASPADPVAATCLGAWALARTALGHTVGRDALELVARPRPERAGRVRRQQAGFLAATDMLRTLAAKANT